KEEAQALPTGEKAEAKQSKSIEDYFKTVSVFIDKAQKFGEKAGELTVKLAPWIEKAVPVLLSARKLIGLP
ncbi:MAG: hypothetical protein GY862_38200, partial [Gammaproteobacteria bacterium]|nr:hypothetical protein [Gammaproteobacteria bacterium]